MLLYYITDRTHFFPATGQTVQEDLESLRQIRLLATIEAACAAGVDFIQLREKDLPLRQLEALASGIVSVMRKHATTARFLINARTDVAISSGADGVHLRSDDISAKEARRILSHSGCEHSVVGVSCHALDEVRQAAADGTDLVVFGPVFEKKGDRSSHAVLGAERLRTLAAACKAAGKMPVLALGGITCDNASLCIEAGAAGVAGIRLFQKASVSETVQRLLSHR